MVDPLFPLTIPVTVHRRMPALTDEYGDPIDQGFASEDVLVFGVVYGGEDQESQYEPERVKHDLTVYCPASVTLAPRDRIEYDGYHYEVADVPDNWDANPWWQPGMSRVLCNRLEGVVQ